VSKTYIPQILRRQIRAAASECCEYCLVPEAMAFASFHIDHIISEKQGGATSYPNLALACRPCNISKGASIVAYSGEWDQFTRLYHPRQDAWADHFELLESGLIKPLSRIAFGTLQIMGINDDARVIERGSLLDRGIIVL